MDWRRTYSDSRGIEVGAHRFSTHTGFLLNAPQWPAEPSQCDDLLFLCFVQDIAHADGAYLLPSESTSERRYPLAGFEVIIIGRFWVITEGRCQICISTSIARRYRLPCT